MSEGTPEPSSCARPDINQPWQEDELDIKEGIDILVRSKLKVIGSKPVSTLQTPKKQKEKKPLIEIKPAPAINQRNY